MFAPLLSATLLMIALYCGFRCITTYRDPANWHIDSDSKEVEFHSWADIGIFVAVGLLCAIFGALGAFY